MIAKDPCLVLYQVALRQLSVKDTDSHSWFIQIARLCTFYELPTPHEILQVQPSDNILKDLIKTHAICSWETAVKDSSLTKSSLHFLNLQQTSLE